MLFTIPPEKNPYYEENSQKNLLIKLAKGERLTSEQERIFDRLYIFDEQIIQYFKNLKLTYLTDAEFTSVKQLYSLLFNYTEYSSPRVHLPRLYRVVINKSVLPNNRNERIYKANYLSYPPLEVIRRINRYNRANTPDFNVFYATENVEAAIRELNPKEGDIVTISKWENITGGGIRMFQIIGNPISMVFNTKQREKYVHAMADYSRMDTRLRNYNILISKFYSHQFSKKIENKHEINSHREYFFSASLAELVLNKPLTFENIKLNDNYHTGEDHYKLLNKFFERHFPTSESMKEQSTDGIMYASVENSWSLENMAIKPEVIDKKFKLTEIFEFQVTKEKYDSNFVEYDESKELEISCVEHTPFQTSRSFTPDGEIIWE